MNCAEEKPQGLPKSQTVDTFFAALAISSLRPPLFQLKLPGEFLYAGLSNLAGTMGAGLKSPKSQWIPKVQGFGRQAKQLDISTSLSSSHHPVGCNILVVLVISHHILPQLILMITTKIAEITKLH